MSLLYRFRPFAHVLLAACCVVAVGVSSFTPVGADASAAALSGTRDIRDYLKLPGDQVVVVPDGTYTGGWVEAPHPATTGPLGGWLVLVAQNRGKAVIDLSRAPLELLDGTSRIMLVGFRTQNGLLKISGADHIRIWGHHATFPASTWYEQWVAAGGGHHVSEEAGRRALAAMANPVPRTMSIRAGRDGRPAENIEIYGSDFRAIGDKAIFMRGARNVRIEGVRMWDVHEKTYDPGYGDGPRDLIHNSSLMAAGEVSNFTLAHSYSGQRIMWAAQTGDLSGAAFRHLWMANSDGAAFAADLRNGHSNTGKMSDIRAFSNGRGDRTYNPRSDIFRIDLIGGQPHKVWPDSHHDPRLQITTTRIHDKAPPSGLEMNGGWLVDEQSVLAHPANPANAWRRQHPYDSWMSSFAVLAPARVIVAPGA